VLAVSEKMRELAGRYALREVSFDPWRFKSEAMRLEADLGLILVEFPQSHARMTVASEGLHKVIVEVKLTHPGHLDLDRHCRRLRGQADRTAAGGSTRPSASPRLTPCWPWR